jgi:hypothetical protein
MVSAEEKLRTAHRENADLQLRVTHLLSEMDELRYTLAPLTIFRPCSLIVSVNTRAEKEAQSVQNQQSYRVIERQLNEENSIGKTLQGEKEALVLKAQRADDEFHQVRKNEESLANECHTLRQELAKVQSRYETAAHRFK